MAGKYLLCAVLFLALPDMRSQAQQRQGLQFPPIPPGSLFSVEVEVEPPPPRRGPSRGSTAGVGGAGSSQSGAGSGGQAPQPGMMGSPPMPMSGTGGGQGGAGGGAMAEGGGAMAGSVAMQGAMGGAGGRAMMSGGGALPSQMGALPMGIVAQTSPARPMPMATMRYLVGSPGMAPPGFEEPCKCEVECCQMPTEPRRPLPILHLPMVFHYGCCGCVDCPPSLSPFISFRIRYTMMMASRMGMRPGVMNAEGELPDVISR